MGGQSISHAKLLLDPTWLIIDPSQLVLSIGRTQSTAASFVGGHLRPLGPR
jgi:hypothetical protein